jgi:protein-S-isoprenylcysteine O-methyltransferase Ste14
MTNLINPLLVFVAFSLYGLVHSLLASLTMKAWITRSFKNTLDPYYRLIYSIFGALSLLPVLALTVFLPDRKLYTIPDPWILLTLTLQAAAGFGALATLRQTDSWIFLGFKQLIQNTAEPKDNLRVDGLYRYMRHPIYSFGLVILWLYPWMSANILALIAAMTLYILVGAVFEERKLLVQYGDAYRAYQKNTPFLIPNPFRKLAGG